MKFESLRFKINIAILTTCAVIAVSFAGFFLPFHKRQRENRLEEIRVLLNTVFRQKREMLANEIFAGQKAALKQTIKEIKKVKGITAITVFNLDGLPFVSTDAGEKEVLSLMERSDLIESPIFSISREKNIPMAVYTSVIQIIGERVGYLKIYYNLAEMEKQSRLSIVFFITLFVVTIVIMGVVLNIMLYNSVIKPVSVLSETIRKVQGGNLGEKVLLDSNDEIGELGAAFNDMSVRLNQQHCDLVQTVRTRNLYSVKLEETNKALEELNTRLENAVEERTRELINSNIMLKQEINERMRADHEKKLLEERLARSQKMEALGLLAGGVAHDLNNVLSGIVSYPDLILMDLSEGDKMYRPIQIIQSSGRKAAAIVQDLLTLARRGVMNMKVININTDIIQDYLASPELAKLRSYYPDVIIETNLENKLLNIDGSAVHLKKTLMNLISNAAEAQPDGGKIIISTQNRYVDKTIQGYEEIVEGDYVVLKVEDYGSGIAPEDLDRIFEPFYTKKVMGRSGTGLGMAVVWGTVQDHNGLINVKSETGVGTVFELFFPVTRHSVQEKEKTITLSDFMGDGESVLVVDDIKEQREIATTLLRKLNYRVDSVASGEEALQYLKNASVDIIVLDMIMDPGMDGLDTYREIIKIHPCQKAIIASGFAESERVKETRKLGAGAYIRKPYTFERIGLALKNELNKSD